MRLNTIEWLDQGEVDDGDLDPENQDFGGEADNWFCYEPGVFTSGYTIEYCGKTRTVLAPTGSSNEPIYVVYPSGQPGCSGGIDLSTLCNDLD
jgi:hypothetical protein